MGGAFRKAESPQVTLWHNGDSGQYQALNFTLDHAGQDAHRIFQKVLAEQSFFIIIYPFL